MGAAWDEMPSYLRLGTDELAENKTWLALQELEGSKECLSVFFPGQASDIEKQLLLAGNA